MVWPLVGSDKVPYPLSLSRLAWASTCFATQKLVHPTHRQRQARSIPADSSSAQLSLTSTRRSHIPLLGTSTAGDCTQLRVTVLTKPFHTTSTSPQPPFLKLILEDDQSSDTQLLHRGRKGWFPVTETHPYTLLACPESCPPLRLAAKAISTRDRSTVGEYSVGEYLGLVLLTGHRLNDRF